MKTTRACPVTPEELREYADNLPAEWPLTRALRDLAGWLADFRHSIIRDLARSEVAAGLYDRVPADLTDDVAASEPDNEDLREKLAAVERERDAAWAALTTLSGLGDRENELLRKYNFVFDKWPKMDRERGPIILDSPHSETDLTDLSPEERWQALAFTLHTNLWETATIAQQSLDRDDETSTSQRSADVQALVEAARAVYRLSYRTADEWLALAAALKPFEKKETK